MIEKIKYYFPSNHFCEIILKVSILLISIIYFLGNLYLPYFSTDSWYYLEISKNIFSDFNKINTFKQFQINEPYNISFPPFYPILINIFNFFFNAGIYAGFFINFIILFFTTIIIRAICLELLKSKIIGYLIVFLLINTSGYISELIGGRSIPLSILIFYVSFYLSTKVVNPYFIMIINGILCGLMFLNRFDTLLASFLLGIVLSILFRKKNNLFLLLLTFLVSFSLINSFYFSDNYEKFGKIFISDNSRTVLAVEKTYVSDYFSSNIDTFIQNPKDWIIKTTINVLNSLLKGFYSINIFVSTITLMLTYFYISIFNKNFIPLKLNRNQKLAFCFFIFSFFQILSVSLTGYPDTRYFIHFLIYTFLFLQIIFHNQNKKTFNLFSKQFFGLKHAIILLIVIIICIQNTGLRHSFRSLIKYPIKVNSSFYQIDNRQIVLKNILSEGLNSKVLWLWGDKYRSEEIKIKTTGEVFGALTGLTVLRPPRNLNKDNLDPFLKDYKPTHIFFNSMSNNTYCKQIFNHISDNYYITKLSEHVYKINQFAEKI
jgi:hypothetical protein